MTELLEGHACNWTSYQSELWDRFLPEHSLLSSLFLCLSLKLSFFFNLASNIAANIS